jgi:trimethylamine--corrinoid protein Co-methyltransferase
VEKNLVYIPPHIIQDALASTPQTFTIWGRDYLHQMPVGAGSVHFGPGPTCTYFMDPHTGERRKARRGDAGLTARVCDALPNLDYIMGLSLFDDVIPVLSPVYEFSESITNTTKPLVAWANNPETAEDIYRMAAAVAGSEAALQRKPIYALFTTYQAPLRNPQDEIGNMLWAAEHGIPVIYLGGPTVGLESPFTAASALVIHLATALSGLAVVQLKRRGASIAIGGLLSAMDLRTARPAYGSPEGSLNTAAAMDVSRYLGVPFMGTGGASESKLVDSQAAIEVTMQLLMSAFSGASLVHDVGFLDCADIGSLELLVMADEIVGMVKRIMRGITVNRETIMLDLIEQIGPGGNYLKEPRSALMCRAETWVPSLLDRNPYLSWDKKGRKSMETRVAEKLQGILNTYQPQPLAPGVSERIEAILAEAEAREGKQVAMN